MTEQTTGGGADGLAAGEKEQFLSALETRLAPHLEAAAAAVRGAERDLGGLRTNDLTQTTGGFSHSRVESSFHSPTWTPGSSGSPRSRRSTPTASLVRIGTDEGRKTRPNLKVGVCGDHGGDPESVHFFEVRKLDYVSCSPFRVPVARLEAARAMGDGPDAIA